MGPGLKEEIVKAVCYVRVSTIEQSTHGVSLEAQEERLQAYCSMARLEVTAMVREEGISGAKPLSLRPGGKKLLALVAKKKVAHVVALKLDRVFRDAADALHQSREWEKAGIALHLVDMGGQSLNTASAMGRFFLNMMAGVAELERNLIAERTTMALAHKKAHLEAYAPTPYGYDRAGKDLKQNGHELAVVALVKEMRDQGWSLRKIAGALNEQGITSKKGGRWHPQTIKYLLENKLYDA
jgi:DNA invertase Pin-like site-specific DNA recombinase